MFVLATGKIWPVHLRSEQIIVRFIFYEIRSLLTFVLAIGKRRPVHLRSELLIV